MGTVGLKGIFNFSFWRLSIRISIVVVWFYTHTNHIYVPYFPTISLTFVFCPFQAIHYCYLQIDWETVCGGRKENKKENWERDKSGRREEKKRNINRCNTDRSNC